MRWLGGAWRITISTDLITGVSSRDTVVLRATNHAHHAYPPRAAARGAHAAFCLAASAPAGASQRARVDSVHASCRRRRETPRGYRRARADGWPAQRRVDDA